MRSLRQAIEEDPDCSRSSFRRSDSEGGEACSVLWNDASDDITGAVCRAQKVAGTMEAVSVAIATFPFPRCRSSSRYDVQDC